MRVQLAETELRITTELRNADSRVMPAGIGLHPYLRHEPGALVGYRATTVWPPTEEFLPGAPRPPQPEEIYAPAHALPAGGLTHYLGGWDGVVTTDLPGDPRDQLPGGARLQITADAQFGHLVVHRPDNLAYLCLEPVSHVADGFNLAAQGVGDTGTHLLMPGDTLAGTISFKILEQGT